MGEIGRACGVVERACSNMLTSEVVGAIGVSSVGLESPLWVRTGRAAGRGPERFPLLSSGALGFVASSLASTLPTLPGRGRTSPSLASLSLITERAVSCVGIFMGLYLAAASLAAMLDGDGTCSNRPSSRTPSALELLLLLRACMGDAYDLPALVLPPVQFLGNGEVLSDGVRARGVPVPALVAASRAPLLPPVYVFVCGLGFTGGLEKAVEAPRRAALCTLYWVSPEVCGTWGLLRALVELIEYPSDLCRRRTDGVELKGPGSACVGEDMYKRERR